MGTVSDLDTRTIRDQETGCLRWQGAHTPTGYGQIVVRGTRVGVHRFAYECAFGPVPEGLEVDHVWAKGCRYRDCVEPSHLEAVTHGVNLARKPSPTHCPKGHEYTLENSEDRETPEGRFERRCRICKNKNRRETRKSRRKVPNE